MKKIIASTVVVFGVFAFAALASASTADVLQPASDVVYDENLIVNGTGIFDSIKVGKQGVGGVTFFNGTIINETTDENDDPIPVTIGDDLRVDGAIWRGATAGPGDSAPIKLNDDVKAYGDLEVLGKTKVTVIEGPNGVGLPLGYGYCNDDGTTVGGTPNISCEWDAGNHRYLVTFEGVDYYYNKFVTVVTSNDEAYVPRINSISDKLIVGFYDRDESNPTGQQTDFSFITYQISE